MTNTEALASFASADLAAVLRSLSLDSFVTGRAYDFPAATLALRDAGLVTQDRSGAPLFALTRDGLAFARYLITQGF